MNPLKRGLIDTVKVVKENKLLFAGLLLIQSLFIISIFLVGVTYPVKIYENLDKVVGPLQLANFNATALETGQPFLPDMAQNMALIVAGYDQMVKDIFRMLILMLGSFLLFNGFLWGTVNFLIKDKTNYHSLKTAKTISSYWKNYVLISLVFLIPTGVVGYFILSNLIFDNQLLKSGIQGVEIVLMVVFYFMVVGFCLLDLKLKKLFKKIFWVGFGQAHWILLGLLSVLVLLLLSLMLIYFGTNSLFLMTLGIVLTVVILVLGKLFLVSVVKRIR